MFPAVKEHRRQLSVEEAQELQTEKNIATLIDSNGGEDELLWESIARASSLQVKHQSVGNVANDDVRVMYGDEFEGEPVATGPGSM